MQINDKMLMSINVKGLDNNLMHYEAYILAASDGLIKFIDTNNKLYIFPINQIFSIRSIDDTNKEEAK